ncbi:MAG: alpha/beta hydrolase [Bacteroidetes bacterium]|nr:alpha/beta hydrolase [Bacteroidota bacterium]
MRKMFMFLCISIAVTFPVQAGTKIVYGSNPKAGHYVHVNGIELYYEVYGRGHPLLLMHGNGGSIHSMRYQIPALAKRFKVIAVDSRAQGRSTDSNAPLTFTLMASDMAGLLDSLDIDSAYVVGWSDGAIIGLKLALDYPQKVAELVADGANFVADSTALPESMLKAMATTTFSDLSPKTQKEIIKHSFFPKQAGIIFDKLNELDLKHPNFTLKQIYSISAPTLVMAGDHDLIKLGHTVKLFQNLPHAELCIVPGAHHNLLQTKSALANRIIIDFLEKPFMDTK